MGKAGSPSSLHIPLCCCLVAKLCPTICDPMDMALLSMGFSRQEYWSGLPFPPPGDFLKPVSVALAGRFFFFFLNHLSHQGSPSLIFGS